MRRDLELCRKILLEVEKHTEPLTAIYPVIIEGYTRKQIDFHVYLLGQAGLLEVVDGWSGFEYFPTSITWEGYEFLEAAKDENVWEKAMDSIRSKGIPVTFELLKIALPEVLKMLFQAS